jgi:aldehyde dehydrogenase (NAD+)
MEESVYNRIFVGGSWVTARGSEAIPVINPATEETMAVVHGASEADVKDACESAAQAFGDWSRRSIVDRANLASGIASAIEARTEEIANLITDEIGTPAIESRALQVGSAVRLFRRAAEIGGRMELVETLDSTTVHRVPIGVVACITPWNYPLYQIASKVAAALVAGCCVVLKPSEVAPGSALILADIMRQLGVPDGVFNVVNGSGSDTGEWLIRNSLIDAVSFTGSTRAGERIGGIAGAGLKRVSLELGGKSPSVILPGADIWLAAERTVAKCFQNAGQTCAALTRLIVPHAQCEQIARIAADVARAYRLGDPHAETTNLGPVATSVQRDRIRELLRFADGEGARRFAGGPERPPEAARGFFVQPSVYIATPEMRVAREEIFGPVLTLLPYRDEEEALSLAQNGEYGLSGAVWAPDAARAESFARRIRSGSISINGAPTHPDAPFGGFRRSGFGRERGRYGIEEFLTTQSIHHWPRYEGATT